MEINGKTIELTQSGFLVNMEEWHEDVATALAAADHLELTDKHWDVIRYLREEYLENAGNQPNNRTMLKVMSEKWGYKVDSKEMYALFPANPSKQAGRLGGLPESKRKGGY